jgi:hypothetical protein
MPKTIVLPSDGSGNSADCYDDGDGGTIGRRPPVQNPGDQPLLSVRRRS